MYEYLSYTIGIVLGWFTYTGMKVYAIELAEWYQLKFNKVKPVTLKELSELSKKKADKILAKKEKRIRRQLNHITERLRKNPGDSEYKFYSISEDTIFRFKELMPEFNIVKGDLNRFEEGDATYYVRVSPKLKELESNGIYR